MTERNELHIWEIECASPSCRKHFHLLTTDKSKPSEGLLCIKCDLDDHKKGVQHVHVKRGDNEYTIFVGYTERASLYRPRMVAKESS